MGARNIGEYCLYFARSKEKSGPSTPGDIVGALRVVERGRSVNWKVVRIP